MPPGHSPLYPPSRQPQTRQRAVCGTKRTISLSPVQLGQRHINRPLVHRFTLVHRLNVGCPHGAGAFQSLCQAPQAPKTALKCELGKLGKLGRGTRKISAARELGKLVPPPLGGDEFQDEFAHVKKTNNVRTSSARPSGLNRRPASRVSLSPVQHGQRLINRPLVHRLNVGCSHGAGASQGLCQAPLAPKTALKRELV